MSDLEAKELALWLAEQGGGDNIGKNVGKDIREAVYVLSPKYIPAPKIDITDLLSKVRVGPLLEEERAEENNTQQDSIEDLEQELKNIESILKSQPNPKLGIEDILKVVSTGPLAQTEDSEKEPEKSAEVIPFYKSYSTGVLGAFLAAAAALILYFPQVGQVTSIQQGIEERESITQKKETKAQNAKSRMQEIDVEEEVPQEEALAPVAQEMAVSKKKRRQRAIATQKESAPRKSAKASGDKERSKSVPHDQGLSPAMKAKPQKERLDSERLDKPQPKSTTYKEESNEDSLSALRSVAWSFTVPALSTDQQSRLEKAQSNSTLEDLLEDSDLRLAFEAAYTLGRQDISKMKDIENFLRIKGGETVLRRRLYALLGDMYRTKGMQEKAKENYQAAIELR